MTKKKIILLTLIVLLTAAVVFLTLVPIDLTERKPFIKSKIEEFINGTIDMGSVSLYVLPYPRIRIENFTLTDAKETLIRSEKLKLGVSFLPLFKKHLAIRSLTAEGGQILLRMFADGRISLQNVLKERIFTVSLKSLGIEDVRIRFIDEGTPEPAVVEMAGINANIYPTVSGFTYRAEGKVASGGDLAFSGEGRWETEGQWTLSGTISIRELDIDPLEPYIKELVSRDSMRLEDVSGLMTLDSDYSFSLGGELKGKGLIKGSVELTNAALEMPGLFQRSIRFGRGSAELDLTWEPDEYVVALDNLRLTVSAPPSDEEFITTGFVKLGSFGPSVNLDLATTPFELRTLFGLLPRKILPDNITAVLSEVESPGGRLAIRGLTFSGTPGVMKWSDYLKALSVWVELERVTFKHPALVNTPYGITGSMRLNDGNLSLENIKGNYGSLVIEGLDAKISDLTVRPSYALDLEVSGKAAQMAGELRRYEFLSVPADLEVKGDASARLHAEGIWDMRGSLIYSGDVDIDGVDLSKGGLPLPLANLSGEAAFDMEKVNIAWLRGRAGGSEFSLSGKVIDYRSAQPFIDFKTNVELLSGTLPLLVKGLEKTAPDFTGPVYIKGSVQGEPPSIRINSFIDITHTDMTFGRLIKKKKGYPLTLKSTIKLDEKNVVIEEGVLSMRSSTVGFAGNIFRDRPGYELIYNSEKVLISDLAGVSPYIIEETGLKGTLEFAIKGRREPEFKIPRYEGKMTFKDWRVDTPLLKNPVTGTEVTSRFSGNSASIIIGDVNTGESSFSGKVEIKDISRGIVEFDLLSENINAADLLPSTRETALEPFITGRGKITVSKGTAWGFAFQNFTTEIEITRDKMSFPANFTTHEGQVSGEVVYFRDPKDPLFFSTSLKLQKISLESLIEKLGAKKPILSGRVDAVAELEGKRGDTLAEGLNGKVQLVARDGRLWEFVVLRKIFSIVNIIAIQELFEKEGLPYRVITGSFNITDGVIRTEDMALDSKTLRMSAVGKIDIPKSAIKATLALHPFVTLDKIISKIPLAGWIFIGEEGTVNMYYRIKGPLKDPEVNPQPIKTIEKGILGILKRIIETPIKALEPKKTEPTEEEEKKPDEE